jgi:hypothetical protein
MTRDRHQAEHEPQQSNVAVAGDAPLTNVGRARAGRILGVALIAIAIACAVAFGLNAGVSDRQVAGHVIALQQQAPTQSVSSQVQVIDGLELPILERDHWQLQGVRTDQIGSHTVVTGYYVRDRRSLVASVISGAPILMPGPVIMRVDGVEIHHSFVTARNVLSWRRGGRTVLVSSGDAPWVWLTQVAHVLTRSHVTHATSAQTAH